jgi:hypothetical protein
MLQRQPRSRGSLEFRQLPSQRDDGGRGELGPERQLAERGQQGPEIRAMAAEQVGARAGGKPDSRA